MSPYIIIAIMIAVDLISVPLFIRSILKKDIKKKGAVIAAFLAVFIAVEVAFSVFYINVNQFYDREGNVYTSQEDVLYYDRDGNEYILYQTKVDRWHFISKDSRYMYTAERVYVDEDGFIIYDKENQLQKTEREYVFIDSDGNEYYPASEIKWNSNGEIKVKNKD